MNQTIETLSNFIPIIKMVFYLEIFTYVGYYAIKAHQKNLYTSANDDKIIVCLISFSGFGIINFVLKTWFPHPEIEIALDVLMGLSIMVAGIAMGMKLNQRLKNNDVDKQKPLTHHQKENTESKIVAFRPS